MANFEIQANDSGQTLFKFIKKSFSTTPLSIIYKWFRKGEIRVNNKKIKDKGYLLNVGDQVMVYDSNKPAIRDQYKHVDASDLAIVYEDQNLLIIDKPANLEVHSPVNISLDDMVKSYLVATKQYDPTKENTFVVSHVHRLDKLTAGLIIYAKNKPSLDALLTNHDLIEKKYLALVKQNKPRLSTGQNHLKADGFMKYDSLQQVAIYSPKTKKDFKKAWTDFNFVKETKLGTLIEATLHTGRKHQIRASLNYYQMPIINDFRYGGPKVNQQRMIFLVAYRLTFGDLPAPLAYLSGKTFEIAWPYDLD